MGVLRGITEQTEAAHRIIPNSVVMMMAIMTRHDVCIELWHCPVLPYNLIGPFTYIKHSI